MVKITNISRSGNIATCLFYPEQDKIPGRITVDLTTKEIINLEDPPESGSRMYAGHARARLCEICEAGEPYPEMATRIWY